MNILILWAFPTLFTHQNSVEHYEFTYLQRLIFSCFPAFDFFVRSKVVWFKKLKPNLIILLITFSAHPPKQDNYSDYFQSKPENSSSSQQGLSYDKLREEHQKRYKEIPVQEKEAPGFFIPQHELARLESGQNQPLWPQPAQPSEVPHSSRQPKAASQPPASSGSDFYGQQIDEQPARRKTTNKYGDEVYE